MVESLLRPLCLFWSCCVAVACMALRPACRVHLIASLSLSLSFSLSLSLPVCPPQGDARQLLAVTAGGRSCEPQDNLRATSRRLFPPAPSGGK